MNKVYFSTYFDLEILWAVVCHFQCTGPAILCQCHPNVFHIFNVPVIDVAFSVSIFECSLPVYGNMIYFCRLIFSLATLLNTLNSSGSYFVYSIGCSRWMIVPYSDTVLGLLLQSGVFCFPPPLIELAGISGTMVKRSCTRRPVCFVLILGGRIHYLECY